jgi:hypothetical protein
MLPFTVLYLLLEIVLPFPFISLLRMLIMVVMYTTIW